MRIWLDVESAPFAATGPGPIINLLSFSARTRLNRIGDWSATLPAVDTRAVDLLRPRRTALAWAMIDGQRYFLGGGTIDDLRVRLGANGVPMLEVSGRDLMEELSRSTVGDVVVDSSGSYDLYAFVYGNLPSTWGMRPMADSAPPFVAHFVHDTYLGGLAALADTLPIWFRHAPSAAQPRTLHVLSGELLPTAMLRASANADPIATESNQDLCLITAISEQQQAADIITRVIPFGAGTGQARLSLAPATTWPDGTSVANPYYNPADGQTYLFDLAANQITNMTAEIEYGRIQRAIAWKEIGPISNNSADVEAAANTLLLAAVEHLSRNRMPLYSYDLAVVGVRKTILPGDLIHVSARKFVDGERPIDIDAELRIIEIQTDVDAAGLRTSRLVVATRAQWPQSDASALVAEIRESSVMQALPQMGPSVDTISYREAIDDVYSADLRFWLGNETTIVNQVLVRFRVDPFRSTAKTVGGTVTGTVDIPDHTHAVEIPDHRHDVPVEADPDPTLNHPLARIVYYDASDDNFYFQAASGTDYAVGTDSGGSSTPTSEDGGGQTGLALDLAPALSLQYGIYEDAVGATYVAADLEWIVNGATVTSTPTATDDGWYELDVTVYVADFVSYRPILAANVITVGVAAAAKSGKRAQITVQIERRTVIQAIAYL